MKKIITIMITLMLAVTMAVTLPLQVLADAKQEYISEVKVGCGESAETAKAALDGYRILSDDSGNPVDLNQNAGGGMGSKGDRVVYLGYKTTTERSEAITDLALMNMKGGYSTEDYEVLMETQMKSQIIPFVDGFLTAIKEYRENYNSSIEANQKRAAYFHDALNKFTDDDCDGAGLGDLLLNETKYEMGDDAYNALSDEEKKQHADILTIVAQSNGQALFGIESALSKATDTDDTTWLERFAETTYESLADDMGLAPSKAAKELVRLYDDNASTVLEKWEDFRQALNDYDEAVAAIEAADETALPDETEFSLDTDKASDEELDAYAKKFVETNHEADDMARNLAKVAAHDLLEGIAYGDGTMLDFFLQPAEDVEADPTMLYPLVASLSDGQQAGLPFLSLLDLVTMAQEGDYTNSEYDNLAASSVYFGVDRAIYEKGGVALTSDALRTKALENMVDVNGPALHAWNIVLISLSALSAAGLVGTIAYKYGRLSYLKKLIRVENVKLSSLKAQYEVLAMARKSFQDPAKSTLFWKISDSENAVKGYEKEVYSFAETSKNHPVTNKLIKGFGVAMIVLTAVTTYLTYQDMKAYYKVDFTPMPHYIVDEKDLIGYNSKGEKTILKNQSAYYKVAETNRESSEEYFDVIGTGSDMNGAVGKQWLALYYCSNEAEDPILAASLKAVVDDSSLPAGYETGIHMFGSDAAFNLNSAQYDWNNSAPATYVYFKRDVAKAAKNAGSAFSTGALAIAGGAGVVVGAIGMVMMMSFRKKREHMAEAE